MHDFIKDPGSLDVGSILRQRGIETFINKSHLVDVPIFPLATIRLMLFRKSFDMVDRFMLIFSGNNLRDDYNVLMASEFYSFFSCFMESVNSQPRDPMKLSGATRWLKDFIDGGKRTFLFLFFKSDLIGGN